MTLRREPPWSLRVFHHDIPRVRQENGAALPAWRREEGPRAKASKLEGGRGDLVHP